MRAPITRLLSALGTLAPRRACLCVFEHGEVIELGLFSLLQVSVLIAAIAMIASPPTLLTCFESGAF